MAEIQLNKPLYNEPPSGRGGGLAAPAGPASPKPSLLARVGAIVLDVFVLLGLLLAFAKYLPDAAVRLGYAGPWIGLLVGFLYFTIGSSALAQGRTIGKFVLRQQTADIAGPSLPLPRAAKRALLLLWPLAVNNIVNQIVDVRATPEEISIIPTISFAGVALAASWYIGNLIYAGMDPHGRTAYDRAAQSIVVCTDAPVADIADFTRQARESLDPVRLRRSQRALWTCLIGFQLVFLLIFWQQWRMVHRLTPDERAQILQVRRATLVKGFDLPIPTQGQLEGQDAQSTDTIVTDYKYLHRGPIDRDALKKNPEALSAVDRIAQLNKDYLLRKAAQNDLPRTMPRRLVIKSSFVEYTDLLFARHGEDVFSVSKELYPQEILAQMRAADPSTTPTAESRLTTTPLETATTATTSTSVQQPTP